MVETSYFLIVVQKKNNSPLELLVECHGLGSLPILFYFILFF